MEPPVYSDGAVKLKFLSPVQYVEGPMVFSKMPSITRISGDSRSTAVTRNIYFHLEAGDITTPLEISPQVTCVSITINSWHRPHLVCLVTHLVSFLKRLI